MLVVLVATDKSSILGCNKHDYKPRVIVVWPSFLLVSCVESVVGDEDNFMDSS